MQTYVRIMHYYFFILVFEMDFVLTRLDLYILVRQRPLYQTYF
jgi:hypothetical protein